jgi:molybdopterin converting factor small subunit
MQVHVHFVGMLKKQVGEGERKYGLPEGASVEDLLLAVGRDFGERLPAQLWDPEARRFHPTVQAARKGSSGLKRDEGLKDGDEIYVFSRLAGG